MDLKKRKLIMVGIPVIFIILSLSGISIANLLPLLILALCPLMMIGVHSHQKIDRS